MFHASASRTGQTLDQHALCHGTEVCELSGFGINFLLYYVLGSFLFSCSLFLVSVLNLSSLI